ncbi:type VI secretion protein IcmF/TssM N-terminal domain-containing protein [Methylovorus sp. MP688]|uniref:type VI secretion protein IcmF/TssM N-terminal domain-containing protein n=1 Tax=Methylovorus sp. (strain MP688) TaxID=887061 RepID=UPI0001EC464F|nr:type VI secretion protein IcmF/TssM N-terminal domain-containing protein [Methylovorus sp. MP688]ADQ84395.1 type VI secretion protein IcmF [Methylovorus sp. MP688]
MQEFFNSPILKSFLAFLAFALVGVAIWFLGPLLAFGEMYPLSSAAMRITVILLLGILVVLTLLEWPKSPVAVAVLLLSVWHAGPLLSIGHVNPLAPVSVRVTVILVILLLYGIWALYSLWQLMRNDEAFARKMLPNHEGKHIPAKNEIKAIGQLARKAVSQLKMMHISMAGNTGSFWRTLRRVVEGKRYLYELPWYMIIGNPGAGKTTVLLNSGLSFPSSEQPEAVSAKQTLANNTGTQHCVWWFTNDAVLIDTSGRYTDQNDGKSAALAASSTTASQVNIAEKSEETDSDQDDKKKKAQKKKPEEPNFSPQEKNRAEWLGFLGVLRQTRSRAPVNGALLVVDVAELLSSDSSQRMAHAANLRARLAELRHELGIRFPVYVLLTKSDTLSGFSEYFSSLTSEGRAQVWGFTLPWQETKSGSFTSRKKSAVSGGQQAPAVSQLLEQELGHLHQRLKDGVALRLQEEFELDRRQALYMLPHEFSALQPPLIELLDAVFSDSRFDTTQLTHMLRGVYLTSAMQNMSPDVVADHRALIPRLQKALSNITRKISGKQQPESGMRANAVTGMRSYFIADALIRVVFPEAHLVKPNLKWEARLRLLRLVGHALVLMIFFWLTLGLMGSYERNHDYLAAISTKTDSLAKEVGQLLGKADVSKVNDVLTESRLLPQFHDLDLSDPSIAYLYGLYAAEPIKERADLVYVHLRVH